MKTVKNPDFKNARATILTRAKYEIGSGGIPEAFKTQLRCSREFAFKNQIKVFGELFVSGKDVMDDLDSLLLFLKEESMTHLLITSADRLSRNHETASRAIEQIEAIGITICYTGVADETFLGQLLKNNSL